ncbi:hypothetical protein QUV83_02880 [Cellulomonas cellasea]|uniref:hypothetical protein n=1 Tax=Cellulomonas cellasea TaxID=43670 RepID=UPI0025A37803|nr:hypothetical protein [Cellulomonas cellasea]MDM8083708.1 hypothetical protein [Cellulomonas cellasea]
MTSRPTRLTGDELFSVGTTVRDFWAYALSDFQQNTARGALAEYLVARAVGAAGDRVEWDAYDVLAPDGTTIEVKTSGHSQAWARSGPAVIAFSGLPGRAGKTSWDATTNTYGPAHVADVYVFAVHTTSQDEPYDGLDIGRWLFHVVPGAVVAATGQGSMRLTTVIRLGGVPILWERLADAITAAAASSR